MSRCLISLVALLTMLGVVYAQDAKEKKAEPKEEKK